MIVTKEQQERIVEKYVKEKHNTDECIGFIDGINATIELINRIKIQQDESAKINKSSFYNPKYCMPDNINTKQEHEQYLKDIGMNANVMRVNNNLKNK